MQQYKLTAERSIVVEAAIVLLKGMVVTHAKKGDEDGSFPLKENKISL